MRDGVGTGRGQAAQRFQDRTVIVTGGAGGQGRREVTCFADEGARVVLVDLDGEASAAAEQEHSGRVRTVVADVSDSEAWSRVLARAEGWAPPTVLVNNAAIHWARPIESSEPADVLRMWQINLLGPLLGIQAVVPVMRAAGGGSIVNISSTAGLTGLPYQASYAAS
jgi:3alpha(or 20beta)-hydroxysteroid dehydrogenase